MNQSEDEGLRRLLVKFTARIPVVGIGEARNELEERLEALISQKIIEAQDQRTKDIVAVVTKRGMPDNYYGEVSEWIKEAFPLTQGIKKEES